MEILKVSNLTKYYGERDALVKALDNVSFKVEKGEFVAIVGASGSGKSTLMHLIGGVDKPTSGKVYIDNQDIYQFYNLIPILNVKENITLTSNLDNRKVNKEKLNEIIKLLGLETRLEHLPNQLSGGEQQRTSIARALITSPALILADEPTGNLDSKASLEIMELLKLSNRKYNQTIIMITHNLELAREADRIIKLEDGKIVEDTNENFE